MQEIKKRTKKVKAEVSMDNDELFEKEQRRRQKRREAHNKKEGDLSDSKRAVRKKIIQGAYERFQERNYAHGHDLDDWFGAEKDIES